MKKKWIYKTPEQDQVEKISSSLGISSVLASLLVNRKITAVKDAENFLNPNLSKLHNPFLLPDMEKAAVRIRKAIDQKEKILVYGDRDVDGVTSVVLMVRALRSLGADAIWTVPAEEGYGLHKSILQKFIQEGIQLLITVDCGISAVDEIDFVNANKIDVIVTDHHLPGKVLPQALAIINPLLPHSFYPTKEMAGCFVAFKLAYAVMLTFNRTFNQEYVVLDLETTGLSAPPDQIIEIGAVCIRNFIPIKKFHTLVRPSVPISKGAMEVHGIREEMVAHAPVIKDVLPEFLQFIGDRTVIAHNAKFDLGFLQVATKECTGRAFMNPFIDTLTRAREIFSFSSYKLTSLAKELHIEISNAHRSMGDCYATASLFEQIEKHADPRLQFFIEDYLDLVALGTIADIVPLTGENRVAVKHGISRFSKTSKIGLKKLMEQTCVKKNAESKDNSSLTAKEISWNIVPTLNAAGRFSKADIAVKLLLTNKENEAEDLVEELLQLNQDRKSLQKTNNDKFLSLVQEQCDLKNDRIIFLVAEGIEHGVTGIVASQLVREYQRPTVLLIIEGDEAVGSSRSIPGFNIVEAFEECKDLLVRYGGHPAAAGLSVKTEQIKPLKEKLKKIAERKVCSEFLFSQIEIDMELDSNAVTKELIQDISKLEPFGEGNPPPLFSLKGVELLDRSVVGPLKNHLRFKFGSSGKNLFGIGWSMSGLAVKFKRSDLVNLAFHLEINHWEKQEIPQLVLSDIHHSSLEDFTQELNKDTVSGSERHLFD